MELEILFFFFFFFYKLRLLLYIHVWENLKDLQFTSLNASIKYYCHKI